MPTAHLGSVAFHRLLSGTLATEPQPPQQMPDMAGMIAHPVASLNQPSQARQRPDGSEIASGFETAEDRLGEVFCLGRSQAWLAASGTFTVQSAGPGLLPCLLPSMSRLAAHAPIAGNRAGTVSLLEEGGNLQPALFHYRMIACGSHLTTTTPHVCLLYEYQ